MQFLTKSEYDSAVLEWKIFKENQRGLEVLLPKNSTFKISSENIKWLKERNLHGDFCVEMGIVNNSIILISIPLDSFGNPVPIEEYPYCTFERLTNELVLVEVNSSVTTRKIVLSDDFEEVSDESDAVSSVIEEPLMNVEQAISVIEEWQNDVYKWFEAEKEENDGVNIFERFYVPSEKILNSEKDFDYVGVFGLKYSSVYEKSLPTLLFIGSVEENQNPSLETISNIFDYARPCPPVC